MEADRGRLVVSCDDRPGIVAAVSAFLFERGANIIHSDQHSTARYDGEFFLRVEFELPGLAFQVDDLERGFAPIAHRYGMDWRIVEAARRKRLAIFVSREDHCLLELLWQRRSGDVEADIALVVGNHESLAETVAPWGVPFHHVPVGPDGASKAEAERRQLDMIDGAADVIVLARYMQILSPAFVARWQNRIINIHHSFLPAFAGASPY
ncbi:MAG: formyltetrahydrofolate deformylase, partial [Chloroflexia bacterium]|nr:formyltetrahydrofolate deformylase [Chloroflexia bacterium]